MLSFRRFFKLESIGYLELGKRVYRKVLDEHCPARAAAIAYYILFAVFPFFLFLATVIGHLPIPNLLDHVMRRASRMLPEQIFDLLQDNIRALFSPKKHGLLPLGLLLALWGSSNAVVCFMDAMNNLYSVKEGRSFWRVRLTAISLVIGLSLLFLLSLVLLMFGRKIGRVIATMTDLGDVFLVVWTVILIPLILSLLTLAVATIYFYAPDVKQKRKWVTPGSLFAVPCWICSSLGFSYYINHFSSYDKTYGTLGAVIILLLWLYISGLVLLVGAVVNSVLELSSKEGKAPGEKVAGEHRQKFRWSRFWKKADTDGEMR
jgi:membrane protein